MLAYYAKRSPGEEFEQISTPIEHGVWIDAPTASDSEIDSLIHTHELDANVVYDVRDRGELPRVEYSNGTEYVFLRLPRLTKTAHVTTLPLLCIVKPTTFITISIGDGIQPQTVALSTIPVTTEHTETLLVGVMASTVAEFEDMISHTSRSITDTANRLKTHEITNHDFIHFVTVEDNLTHCHMNLDSMLAMTKRLRENTHDTLGGQSIEALDDIALHIQQLLVAITSYQSRVESIRNAYSTIANNGLNQRMKTLTVFTVLITLPNVFYGMLGMNVLLPFPTNQPWVFPTISSLTILVILIVYLISRRMRIF
jgi:magnesium transporter